MIVAARNAPPRMQDILDSLPVPKRMFGTAGIRGVTNVEITPQLALGIGIAYGDWMAARAGPAKIAAAVAHDTRHGAEMLARSAANGLASAGVSVNFFGCAATGVFSLNLVKLHQAGGILITGSHMPPDRTGIICLLEDGVYAPVEITDDIEARYHALATRDRRVRPEQIGHLDEAFHPYEAYVSDIVQKVDAHRLRDRRFKVVVDPANGTASYIAKELFEWLGCGVEMIHFDPNPVPDRPSEPRAHTVTAACRRVVETGADLGICFDVDADRVLFITHEGIPVSEDTAGTIFARSELRRGDVCVTPVNSSGLIELTCREAGARLEYCGIGQPPTAKAIKEQGAAFAYEESGKYYFARTYLWADGLFAAAKMLEILLREGKPLAGLVAEIPAFHQVKRSVTVDDVRKDEIALAATRLAQSRLLEGRSRDVSLDGFKRIYSDHSWLLLRKSGTEPLIRVYSDAPTRERAEALVRDGVALVEEAAATVR